VPGNIHAAQGVEIFIAGDEADAGKGAFVAQLVIGEFFRHQYGGHGGNIGAVAMAKELGQHHLAMPTNGKGGAVYEVNGLIND